MLYYSAMGLVVPIGVKPGLIGTLIVGLRGRVTGGAGSAAVLASGGDVTRAVEGDDEVEFNCILLSSKVNDPNVVVVVVGVVSGVIAGVDAAEDPEPCEIDGSGVGLGVGY